MSVLPAFAHVRPTSITEAISVLSATSLPYGGGTELLLAMRAGFLRPTQLVDLKRIAELEVIGSDRASVLIGGGVTHHQASNSEAVAEHLPMLANVLSKVGNARVRASGTLAGNLCFAEPKSDVATALIALDGWVTLQGPEQTRSVPVADFLTGPYATVREPDEILTMISVPIMSERRTSYRKFQTMERPTIGVAISATAERSRLVIGAIGATPQVFDANHVIDFDAVAIAEQLEVIEDMAGASDYKRHIARLYIARAIEDVS